MKYEVIIKAMDSQFKQIGEQINRVIDDLGLVIELQGLSVKVLMARKALINGNVRESEKLLQEAYWLTHKPVYQRMLYVINREETGSEYGPHPISPELEAMGKLGSALGAVVGRMIAQTEKHCIKD